MKRIAYIGEKNDFYRYISLSFDGEISEYSDMETAGADALEKGYDAIIATAPRNSMLPSLSYG